MDLTESVIGWFLTLVTVYGNGHIIYLIITKHRLHTSTNWFVLSLAVADIFVGLCYFPVLYICKNTSLPCARTFQHVVQWTLLFLSSSNLCVMSIDRYLAIVKPLKYVRFMTNRRVVFLVSLAWSSPILTYSVPYIVINTGQNVTGKKHFVLYPFIVLQILPCLTLLAVFVRICVIARRQARLTAVQIAQVEFNHTVPSPPRDTRRQSSVQWFGILLAIFIVCHVVNDFASACSQSTIMICSRVPSSFLDKLGNILIITNSAINPLVYGFLKKDIASSMRKSHAAMFNAIGLQGMQEKDQRRLSDT